MPFYMAIRTQHYIFGKVTSGSPTVALSMLPMAFGDLPAALIDDTKAAKAVLAKADPQRGGIIFYGAKHFQALDNDYNMHDLLEAAGKRLIIINLHRTNEERDTYYQERPERPDADIVIFCPAGKTGIYIYNPDIMGWKQKTTPSNADAPALSP